MAAGPLVLVQGTVDVLVLRALAWGPMHGYAVSKWIRERTNGTLDIEDAPLYKTLHRLEQDGAVDATWGLSDNNRKARFYRLSPAGRHRLKAEVTSWQRYVEAVSLVLAPE
jgi:transcriptional regulator